MCRLFCINESATTGVYTYWHTHSLHGGLPILGIARGHRAQICEEFSQLGSGEPGQKGRLGLGLPICARIATLLGTRIEVRSGLGRGSSFTIELPRAAPGVDAEAQAAVHAGAQAG